ncbi:MULTISPECIES: helix-turn-helix domain-containing protein [Halostella]|uniref:helix-turn-helix domain-containing protein n=1 Tax=Halostella TaxID=1843185 RepID=UPI0013866712|nr:MULTISPECIES: helix-turn-helix domain-containing protein [Halostella]
MSSIAELAIPPEEFILAHTLAAVPDATVEIERVAAATENRVTPYFWVHSDDLDAFDAALREDDTARNPEQLESDGSDRLYRVDWHAEDHGIVEVLARSEATVLKAVANDTWQVRILFPDEDSLSTFHDGCRTAGLSFTVERLYHPDDLGDTHEHGVTEEQRTALVAAYRAGYFAVPRNATLAEVADDLDISSNALSSRLRRGNANLIERVLVDDPRST